MDTIETLHMVGCHLTWRVSLDVQARRGEVSERAHVWVISSDFEHYIITDNANKLEVALDGLRLFKISLIIS